MQIRLQRPSKQPSGGLFAFEGKPLGSALKPDSKSSPLPPSHTCPPTRITHSVRQRPYLLKSHRKCDVLPFICAVNIQSWYLRPHPPPRTYQDSWPGWSTYRRKPTRALPWANDPSAAATGTAGSLKAFHHLAWIPLHGLAISEGRVDTACKACFKWPQQRKTELTQALNTFS